MADDDIHVTWAHGEFTVVPVGAMCAPARFALPDGSLVQPFAIAPWGEDGGDDHRRLPPLLRRLRGDWACVPFGMPQTRADLPADWAPSRASGLALGDWFHGPGANAPWQVVDIGGGAVTLDLVYPDDHPVARLTRRIAGDPQAPRLLFDLEVHPRQDCVLPVGAHPVMRLPEEPGRARLTVEGAEAVFTYPVDAEPGVSMLPHGARFDGLERARWADGSALDLRFHPLARRTEEVLLVTGALGRAHLDVPDEGYRATIAWDAAAFGALNLWVSNGGRGFYPWNHRFRGLGIEPVSAPFDLGAEVAASGAGPLRRAGVPLAVGLRAGEVWRTRYSVAVGPA